MTERQGTKICVRCYVGGLVQGVFFRASTREQALGLGVTGYARNLPDGRVEVLACGPVNAVERLKDWLREGPPSARVTGVACEPVPMQEIGGFSTE